MAAFLVTIVAILSVPGPTNALLAAAGTMNGYRWAMRLIPAATAGYLLAVTGWLWVIGLARFSAIIPVALRIGCAAYLVYTAWRLWHAPPAPSRTPVGSRVVFVTTFLNPKAALLATFAFSARLGSPAALLSDFTAFSLVCVAVTSAWIAIGVGVETATRSRISARVVSRCCSLVLACFAIMLGASIVNMAN